jgi:hypothetical protein
VLLHRFSPPAAAGFELVAADTPAQGGTAAPAPTADVQGTYKIMLHLAII